MKVYFFCEHGDLSFSIVFFYYLEERGRRGCLMVSALDSGSSDPGSSLGRGTVLCS